MDCDSLLFEGQDRSGAWTGLWPWPWRRGGHDIGRLEYDCRSDDGIDGTGSAVSGHVPNRTYFRVGEALCHGISRGSVAFGYVRHQEEKDSRISDSGGGASHSDGCRHSDSAGGVWGGHSGN